MAEWLSMDTAPRDGSEFFARCMRRYSFTSVTTNFADIARWSGKTPEDKLGSFISRSGDLVTGWIPIPALNTQGERNGD